MPPPAAFNASPSVEFGDAGAYQESRGVNEYEYVPGILIFPVASRTPKTATARVHGGYSERLLTFRGAKSGKPPVVPAANDLRDPFAPPDSVTGLQPISDTLVSASLTIDQPSPSNNAGYDWNVEGVYRYVTTRTDAQGGPRIPGRSGFPASRLPYVSTPQDEVATSYLGASSGATSTDTRFIALQPSAADFANGKYEWPFVVMSPVFFDPTLTIG